MHLVRRNQHRRDSPTVLVNISPHSLNDATFFTDFIDYMLFNRELADTLVFEFPAAEFLELAPDTVADLARLAEAGFRFSLDRVRWWPVDPAQFSGRHVGYLKLDAATLQEGFSGDDGRGGSGPFRRPSNGRASPWLRRKSRRKNSCLTCSTLALTSVRVISSANRCVRGQRHLLGGTGKVVDA